jgi:hypothetical protein
VEGTIGKIQFCYGHESKAKDMTWCNDSDDERALHIIAPTPKENSNLTERTDEIRTITCPSCGHNIEFQDQVINFFYIYFICFLSVAYVS